MRYIISESNGEIFNAGKARQDVLLICQSLGYIPFILFNRNENTIKRSFDCIKSLIKLKKTLRSDDMILIQYPFKRILLQIILKLLKNNQCIVLIHDICYLWGNDDTPKEQEINLLNKFDIIICHNQIMKQELLSSGIVKPLIILEIFDYLYNGDAVNIKYTKNCWEVIFAGNLSPQKSGFVYHLPESNTIKFNLYGKNEGYHFPDYVNYKGAFPADQLIPNLQGNFGLVWDGPVIDSCCGKYGEYQRYNNPHKASLYIASGIPLIAWEQAAIADFIKSNNIGITLSSLNELEDKLHNLNESDYNTMRENLYKIRNKLINGDYLKATLRSCEKN